MEIPGQAQEQQRIMRDLHATLRESKEQKDEARTFYTNEAIKDFDHD